MPFHEVVGHARPLGLLSRSIDRGSLPPSLLFTGPPGVGKRLVAGAVAEALNCVKPVVAGRRPRAAGAEAPAGAFPFDACGRCPACVRIAKGTHPDVIVIEPPEVGATKIEFVRPAIAATAYRPFEGRYRVVIVDEADRLTDDAQNALLKSLEEPAASSVFVLVSSRPETLLATIRSRCSRLRFGRLPVAEVARLLAERHGYEAAEAHAIAAVADGSPGRALEAGSRAFRDARDAALATLRATSAATSPKARLQAAALLATVKSSSAGERDELATRITMLASLLRDLALVSHGGRVEDLANGDLGPELQAIGGSFGSERALRAFANSDRAVAALRRNASPKIVAAWLSVRL
jgi:DNA polymerase III subunit delta'